MADTIYSVSQLNHSAKSVLESQLGRVWLTGEISNFVQPISGHWYLSLKDENAQVRCAMFRGNNARVTFRPENGMQVLVRAQVSMYEPRGDYQLLIESMQMAGDGLLQQQFERLKLMLAAEGLFAQQYKKALPHFCHKVGIITSKSGAALHDMLTILSRRSPMTEIILYPTAVQGKSAAEEIAETIALANARQEVDVLIVGRGGGALEDLWCFNEEQVARAIFASHIPIISAVGHETDVTIADFVADLRAPTPSAAAELVSQDSQALQRQLSTALQTLFIAFDRQTERLAQRLHTFVLRLNHQHPKRLLAEQNTQLSHLVQRMQSAVNAQLKADQQRFVLRQQQLYAQHPKRQLQVQSVRLKQAYTQLQSAVTRALQQAQQQHTYLHQRLVKSPLPYQLMQQEQRIAQYRVVLKNAMYRVLQAKQHRFAQHTLLLDNLSPLKVLTRGYSITLDNHGNSVKSALALRTGDVITTRLLHGQVTSQVIDIQKKSEF
ncbi:exodeoxyribonuclease VII large subunit [Pasteurellaceae bacterium HPA106]|uniref:exodeoxyribonuclease VII large subunit n=1 Tax=Spirabiliibacterium pneumoniae TaxID=221400 RepID=UPI001AAC8379|nr:exodeoxyribonuclease VII large subunit [Spirabiliibacterium pneumoniae]MBE2895290.1 exodeoxyribonuclease VII large subunit [Spirabiliibacterium pneumoniae]